MAVDTTTNKFHDIINDINANAPDVASAVLILESTKYDITNPQDVATYLAYSKLAPAKTNPDGSAITKPQPTSVATMLQIPTSIGSIAALAGIKGGATLGALGAGMLAAMAEYYVFDRAEKATEESKLVNIAMLGGIFTAALFAVALFLWRLWPHIFNALPIITPINMAQALPIAQKFCAAQALNFGAYALCVATDQYAVAQVFATDQFLHALALATTITTAVMAAGIIAGKMGQDQAPSTPQASVVNGFLKQIPKWSDLLPRNALAPLMVGLTVSSAGFSLSPENRPNQFTTSTVQVIQAIGGTTQDGAAMLGKILLTTDPNGGPDMVSLVYPGADGNTSGINFALDTNGYLICADGKPCDPTKYLPFFQPIVDGTGKVTGIKKNFGALSALLQIPACTAVANSPYADARTREAALESCLRKNKPVEFIALVGGGRT